MKPRKKYNIITQQHIIIHKDEVKDAGKEAAYYGIVRKLAKQLYKKFIPKNNKSNQGI